MRSARSCRRVRRRLGMVNAQLGRGVAAVAGTVTGAVGRDRAGKNGRLAGWVVSLPTGGGPDDGAVWPLFIAPDVWSAPEGFEQVNGIELLKNIS